MMESSVQKQTEKSRIGASGRRAALCVITGSIIHTLIAVVTFNHSKADFYKYGIADLDQDTFLDVTLNILYLMTIDATLTTLQLSRSGVRVWHWKINTVILIISLINYFSNNKILHTLLFMIAMSFAYNKLKKEKAVFRVGLSKYMKHADDDYIDVSVGRNYKYLLITLGEFYLIYNHYIFFLSPILVVIFDAFTKSPRTKLSDLYVATITAGMDTGLWMALFNIKSGQSMLIDIACLPIYLVIVEILVYLNGGLIKECYDIVNNKTRYLSMLIWIIVAYFTGSNKHHFAFYFANLGANMLAVYMSADVIDIMANHKYFY